MNTQPIESLEEITEMVTPDANPIRIAEPYDGDAEPDEDDIPRREVPLPTPRNVRNCAQYIAAKFAPLVFYGGKFHSAAKGSWKEVDSQVIRVAHNTCPQGGKNVIDSLAQTARIRQDTTYIKVLATSDEESLIIHTRPEKVGLNEILFNNGRLDLTNNDFFPNNSDLNRTKDSDYVVFGPHITFEYDPQEPRSRFFEDYIKQIFPDDEYRKFFQRAMGTILAPHYNPRGYFVFYGPAKTGKSSLATALAYAPAGNLGYETKTEYVLTHDKFEAISLANKFVNVSNDSVATTRWEMWLKQYTSGRISVQAKFRDSESIIPTAKLITTCNALNAVEDIANSFRTRFFPFKFTIPVPDTGAADGTKFLSETFWEGHRKGIVYWLLEGYREFLKKGWRDIPDSWEQDKKEMLDDSNPLEEWLADNLVKCEDAFLTCDELLAQVPTEFQKKAPQANRLAIYGSVSRIFGIEKQRDRKSDNRGKYGFKGISLKGKTNNA